MRYGLEIIIGTWIHLETLGLLRRGKPTDVVCDYPLGTNRILDTYSLVMAHVLPKEGTEQNIDRVSLRDHAHAED